MSCTVVNRPGRWVLGMIASVGLLGCRTPGRDVSEFRLFEEYGGYIPVDDSGDLRVDWVLGDLGGEVSGTGLPTTPEEAKLRVDSGGERELSLLAKGLLLGPLAGTSFLMVVPVMTTVAVAGEIGERANAREMAELERFAGIPVEIRVTNSAGLPLPGAGIMEIFTPTGIPSFLDASGLRSFAPPVIAEYTASPSVIEGLRTHLPVTLDELAIRQDDYDLEGNNSPFGWSARVPHPLDQRCDERGEASFTSLVAARFVERREDGLAWARPPTPIELHHIVWAPGCEPVRHTARVMPGDRVSIEAVLPSRPNGAAERSAATRCREAFRSIPGSVRRKLLGMKADEEQIRNALGVFEATALEPGLPGYLRWNASQMLQGLRSYLDRFLRRNPFASGTPRLLAECDEALERVRASTAGLSPHLREGTGNPWTFADDFDRFYRDVCGPVGSFRHPPLREVAERARGLLRRGEALDPKDPSLDLLGSLIALDAGDRERALALSGPMNHTFYFRWFDGLELRPLGW